MVSHTHINDLVQDVLRSRKLHVPHGWQTFATALKPQDLVGNQDRWQWMQQEPQTTVSFDSLPSAKSSNQSTGSTSQKIGRSNSKLFRKTNQFKWSPYK